MEGTLAQATRVTLFNAHLVSQDELAQLKLA